MLLVNGTARRMKTPQNILVSWQQPHAKCIRKFSQEYKQKLCHADEYIPIDFIN